MWNLFILTRFIRLTFSHEFFSISVRPRNVKFGLNFHFLNILHKIVLYNQMICKNNYSVGMSQMSNLFISTRFVKLPLLQIRLHFS